MRNNSILVGRVSKELVLKKTSKGTSYVHFTLVVQRDYQKNGKELVDTIPCVIWRGPAESLAKNVRKGDLIDLSGMIQTRTYMKNGQKQFVVEVVAFDYHMLESKAVRDQRAANRQPSARQEPFEQENGSYDPYGVWDGGIEISDDDIPF